MSLQITIRTGSFVVLRPPPLLLRPSYVVHHSSFLIHHVHGILPTCKDIAPSLLLRPPYSSVAHSSSFVPPSYTSYVFLRCSFVFLRRPSYVVLPTSFIFPHYETHPCNEFLQTLRHAAYCDQHNKQQPLARSLRRQREEPCDQVAKRRIDGLAVSIHQTM